MMRNERVLKADAISRTIFSISVLLICHSVGVRIIEGGMDWDCLCSAGDGQGALRYKQLHKTLRVFSMHG